MKNQKLRDLIDKCQGHIDYLSESETLDEYHISFSWDQKENFET